MLRKQRQHHHGKTNLDQRTQAVQSMPNLHPLPNTQFTILQQKKLFQDPIQSTLTLYQNNNRNIKQHPQLSRKRYGQLEELQLGKLPFTGGSQIILPDLINRNFSQVVQPEKPLDLKKKQRILRNSANARTTKQNNFADTMQNINIEKIKFIRDQIRKKQQNRKNIQKMFCQWDEENKGYISARNLYNVSRKLKINLSLNDAQNLLRTQDKEGKGFLNLEEFTNLIFKQNDAIILNDLKNSQTLPEDIDISVIVDKIDLDNLKKQQKNNQLKLILKNKLNKISDMMQSHDSLNNGVINYERLVTILNNLELDKQTLSSEDINNIYDSYKIDAHRFDYKRLIQDLEQFQFEPQDLFELKNKQTKNNSTFTNQWYLPNYKIYQTLYIQDCSNLDYHSIQLHQKNIAKIIKQVQRYLPTKEAFHSFIENQKVTIQSDHIHADDVSKIIQNLLLNVGENYTQQDISSLLSSVKYNKGYTNYTQFVHTIYDETHQEFMDRISRKQRGPFPIDQEINSDTSIQNPIKKLRKVVSEFYNPELGMSSYDPSIPFDVAPLLKKVENAIFAGSQSQYGLFSKIDQDKDGYLSHQEIKQFLNKYNIFDQKEMNTFLKYVDPSDQGHLNFIQFSSKIYPSMLYNNSKGHQTVQNSLQPNSSQTQSMMQFLPQIQDYQNSTRNSFIVIQQEPGKTRFGANPPHKNTFYISRPPENSGMYLNVEDRYSRDNLQEKVKYQKLEKNKQDQIQEKKYEKMRENQYKIEEKKRSIESDYEQKKQKKITKSREQFSNYEMRCRIQNEWQ